MGKRMREEDRERAIKFLLCLPQYQQSLIVRLEKLEEVVKKTLMVACYRLETTRELLCGCILTLNRLGSVNKANACHLHHQGCRLMCMFFVKKP